VAIGSAPEIGVVFTTFGKLSESQQHLWYERIRETEGPDGMGDWASLHYVERYVGNIPPIAAGMGNRVLSTEVAK
jgi:hypothetical protein